jgi:hypothetical protein
VIDDGAMRTMKRRVEAGNLSEFGTKCQQRPYHGEVVGLMQRCEWSIPLQALKHVFVDQNWSVVVRAAMDDAMTNRDKLYARSLAQPLSGNRGSRGHIRDCGRCVRFIH